MTWFTKDQGNSWSPAPFPSGTEVDALFSNDAKRAWAAGAIAGKNAWLALTSDGGKTWTDSSVSPDTHVGGFLDIQFLDREFGLAVGIGDLLNEPRPLIVVTHDAGVSWKAQLLPKRDLDPVLRRVRFDSQGVAWAAGGGSIYVSRDKGVSWQLVHHEANVVECGGLAVTKGGHIFVTGGWGVVIFSGDFGRTWERLKLPQAAQERFHWAIDFADDLHGWVGADKGFIITTTDGGRTWRQEETPAKEMIRDIKVIGDRIYAIGDGPTMVSRRVRDW